MKGSSRRQKRPSLSSASTLQSSPSIAPTGMRSELVKDNILITTVSPGLMRTGSPFNAWFKGRHREEFAWFTIADSLPVLTIDARKAAQQIVEACRCGDAELVISWPAKL